jgi:hypothetical protein
VLVNPRFVDAANRDYRLAAGSPGIDAGTSEGTPPLDAAGHARVDDPAVRDTGGGDAPYYDIGAYERVGDEPAGSATPTPTATDMAAATATPLPAAAVPGAPSPGTTVPRSTPPAPPAVRLLRPLLGAALGRRLATSAVASSPARLQLWLDRRRLAASGALIARLQWAGPARARARLHTVTARAFWPDGTVAADGVTVGPRGAANVAVRIDSLAAEQRTTVTGLGPPARRLRAELARCSDPRGRPKLTVTARTNAAGRLIRSVPAAGLCVVRVSPA